MAIGLGAGGGITNGGTNTIVGRSAAGAQNISGCVIVGYCAGYYETGNNKLFIDNAIRASEADGRIKSLVYGEFAATSAAQQLTVNGQLRINTSGTYQSISTFVGADSAGGNIWIGGGGASSVGAAGQTYLGAYNTSVGVTAGMHNTTGASNTSVGYNALHVTTTGYDNTAIGASALYTNIGGTDNVALGYCAGYYETGSNKLFIDNAARASEADGRIKALVYGVFAAAAADQDLIVNGQLGLNITPAAWVTLPAGASGAGLAPLKFTSGTSLATPVAGAVEFTTDDVYFTITTGTARKPVVLANAALTAARIPFVTTNGRLTDSTNIQYDGTNVILSGLKYPTADGTAGGLVTTNGSGLLSIETPQPRYNYLINGGFDFFQRQVPATLTDRHDDTYGPDRWNVLTQTDHVQTARVAGNSNLSGLRSINAGRLKQVQASAQRMGMLQIIESSDAKSLVGQSVIFQASVKCSAEQPIYMAILGWTGTADVVTSDVVKDWTSGTYTADNFFLSNANHLTVLAVTTITPSAAFWADLSLAATVDDSNNLICFIWTGGTAAQNVTLDITECGLYAGSTFRPWNSRQAAQELSLCKRYFEKSYPLETAPGTTNRIGAFSTIMLDGYSPYCGTVSYTVTKRVTVAYPTFYSSNNGAAGYWEESLTNGTFAANRVVYLAGGTEANFLLSTNGGDGVAGRVITVHWAADAEL